MRTPLALIATALIALGGCTALDDAMYPGVKDNLEAPSQSVAAAIPAGQGRVWVYRLVPRSSGVPPIASIDGRFNFYVLPTESTYADVPPGRHWVATDMGNRMEFDVAAGEEVFLRFDLDRAFFGKGLYPVRVDPAVGRREYKDHTGVDTEVLGPPN